MSLEAPYPELSDLMEAMGEAGARVAAIDASEGAAGNLSIALGWPVDPRRHFPLGEPFALPDPVPALAGMLVLVTGSGRRLRDIHRDPTGNLAALRIGPDGTHAELFTSPRRLFARPTSELNSHLATHNDQLTRDGGNFSALLHAQPPHITYLSHLPAFADEATVNQRLLRWEPETLVNLPEGIGVLPYVLPGSARLMTLTVESLRAHRLVLWRKHGVMARSELSITRAADRIEYVETAARYEYMDLLAGGRAEGLSVDDLREIVRVYNVPTTIAAYR